MWFLLSCIIAIGWFIYRRKSLPRGYKQVHEHTPRKRRTPNRNKYNRSKVPEDLDAIIIGSGIGGLTTAALLSKVGWRVLVLEQHYVAGGCIHNFEDQGFEWDTGLHYLGDLDKRKDLLDLIADKPIEWKQMGYENDGIYDLVIYHHGKEKVDLDEGYKFKAGKENLIEGLIEKFPEEEEAIRRYVNLVEIVAKKRMFFLLKILRPKWLAKLIYFLVRRSFEGWARRSALEVVQELTEDKVLQSVLTCQWGDNGVIPSQVSFLMQAGVTQHYMAGAWYPKYGADSIVNAIIPTIEKSGGTVLTRAKVSEILVDGTGRARGVKVNGDSIFARYIISNAGFFNTRDRLLPYRSVPRSWYKIGREKRSIDIIYLFVGLEGTPDELNLPSHNLWSYPQEDYDDFLEKYLQNPLEAPMFAFISFPCTRYDREYWNRKHPGRSNCLVLTVGRYEWFEEWKDFPQGKRGDDYEDYKSRFKERMLEELFRYYPNLKTYVSYTEVGTPLSFEHFIGSDSGAFGLEMGIWRFEEEYSEILRPETDVPGLYLTGQDISTLGVFGAASGGVLTAHAILGYGGILDIITGRNLFNDLR